MWDVDGERVEKGQRVVDRGIRSGCVVRDPQIRAGSVCQTSDDRPVELQERQHIGTTVEVDRLDAGTAPARVQNLCRKARHLPFLDVVALGHIVRHRGGGLRHPRQQCVVDLLEEAGLPREKFVIDFLQLL